MIFLQMKVFTIVKQLSNSSFEVKISLLTAVQMIPKKTYVSLCQNFLLDSTMYLSTVIAVVSITYLSIVIAAFFGKENNQQVQTSKKSIIPATIDLISKHQTKTDAKTKSIKFYKIKINK